MKFIKLYKSGAISDDLNPMDIEFILQNMDEFSVSHFYGKASIKKQKPSFYKVTWRVPGVGIPFTSVGSIENYTKGYDELLDIFNTHEVDILYKVIGLSMDGMNVCQMMYICIREEEL